MHSSTYPELTLVLRAPMELENFLPCDIRCIVYDEDHENQRPAFIPSGGLIPIHGLHLGQRIRMTVDISGRESKYAERP